MDRQNRVFTILASLALLTACARPNLSQGREGAGLSSEFSVAPAPASPIQGAPRAESAGVAGNVPSQFAPPEEEKQVVSTVPGPTPSVNNQGKTFAPLRMATPQADYFKNFEASSRPRFQFNSRLEKAFGARLNRPEALSSKSERVFAEMQRVANREVPTEKALLMIPADEARKWSLEVERTGRSPKAGAWSIAVKQTAVRHGFSGVPCAEFVSEVVREAYQRAEVDLNDDFNHRNTNRLIWSETASVAGLKKALLKAGWVPWNAHDYVPPIGAIMMNGVGETPGHVFLAAGHSGRLIVDNGSPQGRDLGATSLKLLKEMYSAGVFFLPPGVNPGRWR